MGVYVVDLIITDDNNSDLKHFKQQMQENFLMADMGKLQYYLGLEGKQTSTGTMVS
jgi:hypothetical protein